MEEEIKVEIGEVIIIETITDPTIETDQEADGTVKGQVIGGTITRLIIDNVMLDQIIDKMLHRHLETEVKIEIELEITIITIQEAEVEIEIITGPISQDRALYLVEEMNLGPDPL